MLKIKIILYEHMEIMFDKLEKFASKMREKFAICNDCGRNRYTGKPCKNLE